MVFYDHIQIKGQYGIVERKKAVFCLLAIYLRNYNCDEFGKMTFWVNSPFQIRYGSSLIRFTDSSFFFIILHYLYH